MGWRGGHLGDANSTGIWVDSNRVVLSSPADSVRDLGIDNAVRTVDREAAVESGQTSSSAIATGSGDRLVATVRTRTLTWEGEQTYIALYADGTAPD